MAKSKKPTPVERLVAAMDRCAVARGEAQWTNGYRAGRLAMDHAESDRLYSKEMFQWKAVVNAERAFRRLAQRIIAEARRD
jgi:hypothetical protein